MASRFSRSRLPRSLVGQSLLASVSALLLVMIVIGACVGAVLVLQPEPFSWEGPENQERRLERAMRFDPDGRLQAMSLAPNSAEAFDVLSRDMAYQVLDAQGIERFASPEGRALDVLRRQPVRAAERIARAADAGVSFQILTTRIERPGGRYLLRIAGSDRLALGIRSHGSMIFYAAAVWTGILAILVFSAIAFWMARRTVAPLRVASEAATAIEPSNLTQRVDGSRLPSEITPLVDAFNSALDRLEQGYRVQQEFLAAAAHELKTPLALMRAEIELGSEVDRTLLLQDIDAMALQVQQLLQLAEVSEARNFKFTRLDIRHLVEEVVARSTRLAGQRGIHLSLVIDTDSWLVEADGAAVQVLIRNLVENAIHHSPSQGTVTIRLAPRVIAVIDEGPGVAPADRSRLFTRFWRGDAGRYQGAGLGLSICQEIAGAHGWKLAYVDAMHHHGAEFRIVF